MLDIKPPPPEEFELRVIVWKTEVRRDVGGIQPVTRNLTPTLEPHPMTLTPTLTLTLALT